MPYKIRADCSYSTAGNQNTAVTNIQNALNATGHTPVAGTYPAGLDEPTSTRVTVSVDVDDAADAVTLFRAILAGAAAVARSSSKVTLHLSESTGG